MNEQRFKVGIVGLEPGRSWAARAHVPALQSLAASYEIVGVANTSLASAEKARAAAGLPRAFTNVAELVSAPEVDIVSVTVKVPHHLEIVRAALNAGKHVYCEWPLGNGLAEAEELAVLATSKKVLWFNSSSSCSPNSIISVLGSGKLSLAHPGRVLCSQADRAPSERGTVDM